MCRLILKNWEQLPEELQLDEVKPYYKILKKKKNEFNFKKNF